MPSCLLADPCHSTPCATLPCRRARRASSLPWGAGIVLTGLLVLAGLCFSVRPALAQAQLDCPLPAGVTPLAPPRVTAQQVEDGSASLTDFALAVRDIFVSESQGITTLKQLAYVGCLFRQEGGPWRSGSTYIVRLTPSDRVFIHAKDMALSGRQLKPVIYEAILHALGIDPADLTSPMAARTAFAAAATRNGGAFNVPDIPGASGYAIALLSGISGQQPVVVLAGFDLDSSHLAEEEIEHIEPPVTARDVVDRATLKSFVTAAGEYFIELLSSGDLTEVSKARVILRDPNGPWRHGSVYVAIMERVSRIITLHGGFPDRFEFRRGGIARDIATGELIVDQLVAAAESGPEGGFWEYYFDNPADDNDSVEVPKVGYARVFTVHIPRPDGSTVSIDYIVNSGFYLGAEGVGDLVGRLENPGPHSFQSGVGALWGWVCDAALVEIEIETAQGEVGQYLAEYGMERLDTLDTCGDADNGFVLLFNWNRLGAGEHMVTAMVDGMELGRATVRVTTVGEGDQQEFLRGAMGECVAEDFPYLGQSTRLEWQQPSQNFVITDVQ